jgi:ferredoxin
VVKKEGDMPDTRQLPTIEIDEDKCISPLKCGKCLRVCPGGVVLLCAPKYNEKFRECAYEDFTVIVHNRPSCIACNKCVDVCPVDCIKIGFEEEGKTIQ